MRTALALMSVVALTVGLSACSLGGDDVTAREREQDVVDTVTEAVPLAQEAIEGTEALVDGKWNSCPGGVGHRFTGGGVLDAPEGDAGSRLEAVRAALTEAGYEDVTKVDGHVSVTRDEVTIDIRKPTAVRGPRAWPLSFYGPCKRYSGDDEAYVNDQNLADARTLYP